MYQAQRGKMNICKIENCEKPIKAFGYCQTHYKRLRSHGSTDKPPPKGNGRRGHPMYGTWRGPLNKGVLCEEWQDFWTFLKAVGDRPSKNYYLQRKDKKKLFSLDNFYWQERLKKSPEESLKKWHARKWQHRMSRIPKKPRALR